MLNKLSVDREKKKILDTIEYIPSFIWKGKLKAYIYSYLQHRHIIYAGLYTDYLKKDTHETLKSDRIFEKELQDWGTEIRDFLTEYLDVQKLLIHVSY